MQVRYVRIVCLCLGFIMLSACTHLASVGGKGEKDSGPLWKPRNLSKVPDAKPKWEPKSKRGNHSPYKVFGKKYHVLNSSENYSKKGLASWYGRKFHGRTTSSGEVYDMFQMTAAHKSLPLPTYARVTNLDNGRQVVVKINDRGPFVHDRLIDLSYTAATKLDFADKGVANVKVETITFPHPSEKRARIAKTTPDVSVKTLPPPPPLSPVSDGEVHTSQAQASDWKTISVESASAKQATQTQQRVTYQENNTGVQQNRSVSHQRQTPQNTAVLNTHAKKTLVTTTSTHLQVEAFSHKKAAEGLQQRLSGIMDYPVYIAEGASKGRAIYRVRIGPLSSKQHVQKASDIIAQNKLGPPLYLSLPNE